MKYLLWSDLHAYPHTVYSCPTESGLTTYLEELFATGNWLENLMMDELPDAMIFLGDYFHTFGQIDMQSLQALKIWERLVFVAGDLNIPAVALVGNHDYFDIYANIHSLPTAPQVIDKPRLLEFGEDRVQLLPFRSDVTPLREILRAQKNECDIVFAHVPIKGAFFATGAIEQHGLDISDFNHARIVFNGHYHVPAQLVSADNDGSPDIHLVGAVVARTFNDLEQEIPHGALIYDSDNGEVTRFANPHSSLFSKFEVHDDEDVKRFLSGVGEDTDRRVVRVKAHAEYKDQIEESVRGRVKFLQLSVLAPELGLEEARSEISINETPVNNLDRYIDLSECADPGYGREILKQVIVDHPTDIAGEFMLSYVAIENFLSVGKVEYEATEGSLVLVEGKNGSGKTSLQEAIVWAIYGTSPRGKGNDVIREGAKSCRVELEVEIGGKLYMIARGRKDRDYGTGVHLSEFNEKKNQFVDLTTRLGKGTQSKIESLVGVPEIMMRQIVFLTQSLEHRFTDLGDADRKRLLGTLSGVQIYEHCERRAREEAKELEHELAATQGRIDAAERSCERQETQIASWETRLEDFGRATKAKAAQIKKDRQATEKLIADTENDLTGMVESVNKYAGELTAIEPNIEDVNTEISNLQAERWKLEKEKGIHQNTCDRIEQVLGHDICPTCGQSVDSAVFQEEYDTAISEIDRLDIMLDDFTRSFDECRNRLSEFTTRRRELSQHVRDLTGKQDRLQADLLATRRNLDSLRGQDEHIEKQKTEMHTRLKFARDEHKAATEEAKAATAELDERREQIEVVDWWIKAFGKEGIVSWIYDEVIIYLNERLQVYSEILFGDIFVSLSSTRELKGGGEKNEIDIQISVGRPYRKLSSGERRRIDLAIQFALNDLAASASGFSTNLLVCDEIDDYLDWGGKTGLVDILTAKTADKMFVLLMTHNSELKALIPKRWQMINDGGISSLYKAVA